METLFLQSRIKKVFPHILNNLSPFFAVFLFSLLWSSIGYSAEVSLAWDPNNEPDLAGYTLYYGTSSGSYASSIPLGKVTAYTVTNLNDGVPYYFALTARNTTGLESGYSNQVSYIPAVSQFTLTVSTTGSGSGTVIKSPAGTAFNAGTLVSLNASANANSMFTGWSGACSGTANPCSVTMSANAAVTAAYAIKTYTLNASAGSNGTVSPSRSVTVNYGGSQTYAIAPAAGFNVANVLVDGVSVGAVTSYAFSSVTANHTLSATFAAITSAAAYTLSISKIGDGQGNVSNKPGGKTFKKGTKVTLSASPNSRSIFSGWGGACSGTAGTCTVTMNTSQSVTASFSLKKYSITALAGQNGFITPDGITTVSDGANQTYNIQAASGYQISEVMVDGVTLGALGSHSFQNIQADHQISASFTNKSNNSPPHSLKISKKGSGKGMVKSTPEGSTFYDNTVVTLTAASEGDSIFVGWSGACVGEDPQCTITMSSDLSLTATFDVKLPSNYKNYLPIILN